MTKKPILSQTILQKRIRKFTTLKRGYYSFIILTVLYLASFFLPFFMNSQALLVSYEGKWYFPLWRFYSCEQFGFQRQSDIKYRNLQRIFAKQELARSQGIVQSQTGFYPNKTNIFQPISQWAKAQFTGRSALIEPETLHIHPKWEPVEDWLVGYRLDLNAALANPRFTQYFPAAKLLAAAEQDLETARTNLAEFYRQADPNWPGDAPLLQKAWKSIGQAIGDQFTRQELPAISRELGTEIQAYKDKEKLLSEREQAYYAKIRRLFQLVGSVIRSDGYLQTCKQGLDRQQVLKTVYLRYWNEEIAPATVNPSWLSEQKRQAHTNGVGFNLKCHRLPGHEQIAQIDEITDCSIEALHVKNYNDFYQPIIQAERSLPKHDHWVLLPLYSADYRETFPVGNEYPTDRHWLGTDDIGRDVFVRMCYGFNISLTFALIVILFSYSSGIAIGAILGFYGHKTDLIGLRLVEIWSAIPFLYVVIILSTLVVPETKLRLPLLLQPALWMLTLVLSVFGWMGISSYVRGEVLREKAKEYVAAAISIGTPSWAIIFRHILPNALTSVISFAPFIIVGNISSLVSLDFLGFGLPSPMPSWGELLRQGMRTENGWHMLASPFLFLFLTLMAIVFIGEAIREAFDPKVYSRLQ